MISKVVRGKYKIMNIFTIFQKEPYKARSFKTPLLLQFLSNLSKNLG